jgi:hypothetical protein
MSDQNLRDDMLKLVRYKILFLNRDYEHAFPEQEELVTDNLDAANYTTWKIVAFIQHLRQPTTPVPLKWKQYPPNDPQYREGGMEVCTAMNAFQIFQVQFALSLILYTCLAKWYVWPRLQVQPWPIALEPLLVLHAFRHIGLLSLLPIVVDPRLTQTTFAMHQAYGDLLVMILALLSLIAIRNHWRAAMSLVWACNVVGMLDLLEALYNAISSQIYNFNMYTFWLVATFIVPALLVTHIMMFIMLLRRPREN